MRLLQKCEDLPLFPKMPKHEEMGLYQVERESSGSPRAFWLTGGNYSDVMKSDYKREGG